MCVGVFLGLPPGVAASSLCAVTYCYCSCMCCMLHLQTACYFACTRCCALSGFNSGSQCPAAGRVAQQPCMTAWGGWARGVQHGRVSNAWHIRAAETACSSHVHARVCRNGCSCTWVLLTPTAGWGCNMLYIHHGGCNFLSTAVSVLPACRLH